MDLKCAIFNIFVLTFVIIFDNYVHTETTNEQKINRNGEERKRENVFPNHNGRKYTFRTHQRNDPTVSYQSTTQHLSTKNENSEPKLRKKRSSKVQYPPDHPLYFYEKPKPDLDRLRNLTNTDNVVSSTSTPGNDRNRLPAQQQRPTISQSPATTSTPAPIKWFLFFDKGNPFPTLPPKVRPSPEDQSRRQKLLMPYSYLSTKVRFNPKGDSSQTIVERSKSNENYRKFRDQNKSTSSDRSPNFYKSNPQHSQAFKPPGEAHEPHQIMQKITDIHSQSQSQVKRVYNAISHRFVNALGNDIKNQLLTSGGTDSKNQQQHSEVISVHSQVKKMLPQVNYLDLIAQYSAKQNSSYPNRKNFPIHPHYINSFFKGSFLNRQKTSGTEDTSSSGKLLQPLTTTENKLHPQGILQPLVTGVSPVTVLLANHLWNTNLKSVINHESTAQRRKDKEVSLGPQKSHSFKLDLTPVSSNLFPTTVTTSVSKVAFSLNKLDYEQSLHKTSSTAFVSMNFLDLNSDLMKTSTLVENLPLTPSINSITKTNFQTIEIQETPSLINPTSTYSYSTIIQTQPLSTDSFANNLVTSSTHELNINFPVVPLQKTKHLIPFATNEYNKDNLKSPLPEKFPPKSYISMQTPLKGQPKDLSAIFKQTLTSSFEEKIMKSRKKSFKIPYYVLHGWQHQQIITTWSKKLSMSLINQYRTLNLNDLSLANGYTLDELSKVFLNTLLSQGFEIKNAYPDVNTLYKILLQLFHASEDSQKKGSYENTEKYLHAIMITLGISKTSLVQALEESFIYYLIRTKTLTADEVNMQMILPLIYRQGTPPTNGNYGSGHHSSTPSKVETNGDSIDTKTNLPKVTDTNFDTVTASQHKKYETEVLSSGTEYNRVSTLSHSPQIMQQAIYSIKTHSATHTKSTNRNYITTTQLAHNGVTYVPVHNFYIQNKLAPLTTTVTYISKQYPVHLISDYLNKNEDVLVDNVDIKKVFPEFDFSLLNPGTHQNSQLSSKDYLDKISNIITYLSEAKEYNIQRMFLEALFSAISDYDSDFRNAIVDRLLHNSKMLNKIHLNIKDMSNRYYPGCLPNCTSQVHVVSKILSTITDIVSESEESYQKSSQTLQSTSTELATSLTESDEDSPSQTDMETLKKYTQFLETLYHKSTDDEFMQNMIRVELNKLSNLINKGSSYSSPTSPSPTNTVNPITYPSMTQSIDSNFLIHSQPSLANSQLIKNDNSVIDSNIDLYPSFSNDKDQTHYSHSLPSSFITRLLPIQAINQISSPILDDLNDKSVQSKTPSGYFQSPSKDFVSTQTVTRTMFHPSFGIHTLGIKLYTDFSIPTETETSRLTLHTHTHMNSPHMGSKLFDIQGSIAFPMNNHMTLHKGKFPVINPMVIPMNMKVPSTHVHAMQISTLPMNSDTLLKPHQGSMDQTVQMMPANTVTHVIIPHQSYYANPIEALHSYTLYNRPSESMQMEVRELSPGGFIQRPFANFYERRLQKKEPSSNAVSRLLKNSDWSGTHGVPGQRITTRIEPKVRTCGQSGSSKFSRFTNHLYPSMDKGTGVCIYRLYIDDPTVCQVRVHLDTSLMKMSEGFCKDQIFSVRGTIANPAHNSFCGRNRGQHFYLDLLIKETRWVDFFVTTNSDESFYKFAVDVLQIECASRNALQAPLGCFQYFQTFSGMIRSFNFDGNEYQNDVQYKTCIRKAPNACRAEIHAYNNASFGLQKLNSKLIPRDRAGVGSRSCARDYLYLSNSEINGHITGRRFCGGKLSHIHGDPLNREVSIYPNNENIFELYFKSGIPKLYNEETHGPGFSLHYQQVPCDING